MLDTLLPAPVELTSIGGAKTLQSSELETLARKLQPWAPRAAQMVLRLIKSACLSAEIGRDERAAETGAPSADITAQLDPSLGEEGYTLDVGPEHWTLRAGGEAGAFWAVQTLRQLGQPGSVPFFTCKDSPKHAIRSVMLDVARHFFDLADIKRLIDVAAGYKFNQLHLHLTDDQGWRLEIEDRPLLTELASGTDCSNGSGGYLTLEDYRELQEYALERHVVVVPEIDLPGHTHAALLAYPEISPDEKVREPYTGVEVGFTSIDLTSDAAWAFVDDVVASVSRNTIGPRIHLGGDEALTLERDEYVTFVERLGKVASQYGKQLVMWQEAAGAQLPAGSLIQYWTAKLAADHLAGVAREHDVKFIASPGHRAYLDHIYTPDFGVGQTWAGTIELRDSYDWEPIDELPGIPAESIEGVEACVWTETIPDFDSLSLLLLPRLCAIAEVAWGSPKDWERFRSAVAVHGRVWADRGLNFHPTPQVDWS